MAHTLSRGRPRLRDFAAVDPETCRLAAGVSVEVEAALPEFGAVLKAGDTELARVAGPSGSPSRPASAADLAAKVRDLAGAGLDSLLDDLDAPAAVALAVLG